MTVVAGRVVYTPAPGFHGEDSFTYSGMGRTDGELSTAEVTVGVEVAGHQLHPPAGAAAGSSPARLVLLAGLLILAGLAVAVPARRRRPRS